MAQYTPRVSHSVWCNGSLRHSVRGFHIRRPYSWCFLFPVRSLLELHKVHYSLRLQRLQCASLSQSMSLMFGWWVAFSDHLVPSAEHFPRSRLPLTWWGPSEAWLYLSTFGRGIWSTSFPRSVNFGLQKRWLAVDSFWRPWPWLELEISPFAQRRGCNTHGHFVNSQLSGLS